MSMPDAPHADRILIAAGGGLLLLVFLVALIREVSPEWKSDREATRAAVEAKLGADKAAMIPAGIQQIWIESLGRVDRCTTCHAAMDAGEALRDAPHPSRSHPLPELMRSHPVESFGCTLCHGGQGTATTAAAAHGHVAFWEEPLLDTARAETYGLTRRELMELRCNSCHWREEHVEGMPLLNRAKQLVNEHNCARCHTIHGEGGQRAPDLSREGDKHASRFHFPDNWSAKRTTLLWHIEHFIKPRALVPESRMAEFDVSRRDATALALLVMSWQDLQLPPRWNPKSR